MVTTLLAMLVVIAVGGGATGRLRTAALESVLTRLPEEEAVAYYDLLRRRQRKVTLMRVLALASLVCLLFVYRQRLVARQAPPAAPPAMSAPAPGSSGSSPSAPAPPR